MDSSRSIRRFGSMPRRRSRLELPQLRRLLSITGIIETVAEQNEWVTIRQLPDGNPFPGCMEGREEQRMRLSVPSARITDFMLGAPVEVQCEQFLYLGVILSLEDPVILVGIEHAMDRAALTAIRNVWHDSPEV